MKIKQLGDVEVLKDYQIALEAYSHIML